MKLLKLILPEFLVENFNLISYKNSEEKFHLYFEEIDAVSKHFPAVELVSKGFLDEITIQDFPLRSKLVNLHIKKHHWINKSNKEIIKRDWSLVANEDYMTDEFATFLKQINR